MPKKKRKYHEYPEKKRQAFKKRYDKKEPVKQYKNKNIWKIHDLKLKKQSITKILTSSCYIKNSDIKKIQKSE